MIHNVSLMNLRPTLFFLPPLIFSLSSLHLSVFAISPPSLPLHFPHLAVALPRLSPVSLSPFLSQEEVNNMTFNHNGNMNSPALGLFFHVLTDLFLLPAPLFFLEMIISAPGD